MLKIICQFFFILAFVKFLVFKINHLVLANEKQFIVFAAFSNLSPALRAIKPRTVSESLESCPQQFKTLLLFKIKISA